jgi:hypothetical protein
MTNLTLKNISRENVEIIEKIRKNYHSMTDDEILSHLLRGPDEYHKKGFI